MAAQARYYAPAYDGPCSVNWLWDNTIQAPVLIKHTLKRANREYEIVLSNHDAYGQPGSVTETGEIRSNGSRPGPSRTTTYSYDYDPPRNQLVGRVTLERVCEGSECVERSRTFNEPSARQLDSETVNGIATAFRYWPDGNLRSGRL